MRGQLAVLFAAMAVAAAPLGAQGRDRQPRPEVPRDHLPPPGMCRIWLDKVPPAQQPAPTDCASAVRNLPKNARVIFNDPLRAPKLPIKSLKPPAEDEKEPAKAERPEKKPLVKPARPKEPEPDAARDE